MLALPLTQVGADFENPIVFRQLTETFQARQEIRRQPAAAGADFHHAPRAQILQDLGALHGHACAEQTRNFRRRREVASLPQFVRAAAVVTQAWRIQRKIHESLEAEPTACLIDLGGNLLAQPCARCGGLQRLSGCVVRHHFAPPRPLRYRCGGWWP